MRPFAGLILVSLPLSLGGCGFPIELTIASYAADAGLLWFTDKSSNDHFLSMVAGQDCAIWRVVKGRPICADHKPGAENPYDIDYDAPHREVGEGGHVAVYTASRQGGRLLTDQEALATLRGAPPTVAVAAKKPAADAIAPTAGPPSISSLTAELSDTPAEATAATRRPGASVRADPRRGKAAVAERPVRAAVRRPVAAAPRSASAKAPTAAPRSTASQATPVRWATAGPSHSTAMAAVTRPADSMLPDVAF